MVSIETHPAQKTPVRAAWKARWMVSKVESREVENISREQTLVRQVFGVKGCCLSVAAASSRLGTARLARLRAFLAFMEFI